MVILRRNAERRCVSSDGCTMWLTFYAQEPAGPSGMGFGIISVFNEVRLLPNESVVAELADETELVTYVFKGALALDGSVGRSRVITAGEFQCMTIGRTSSQRVSNMSHTDLAHFFRIYLRLPPSVRHEVDCVEALARFTAAQRRNVLCAVVSSDGRESSLRIHPDAHIYSSILDQGRYVVHELREGRGAWLHIVYGKATVNGVELAQGDGIGITNEPSLSLAVKENTELLLVDTIPDSP